MFQLSKEQMKSATVKQKAELIKIEIKAFKAHQKTLRNRMHCAEDCPCGGVGEMALRLSQGKKKTDTLLANIFDFFLEDGTITDYRLP